MTRAELVPKVAALRAEGLIYREIGERLGISVSYAGELARDPSRAKTLARRATYGRDCARCGKRTDGSNGPASAPEFCDECMRYRRRAAAVDRILNGIRKFHERYGRVPSASDFNPAPSQHDVRAPIDRFHRDGDYPYLNEVQSIFGSWNAAVVAAGFAARPTGTKPGDFTPEQVAEMVRLYKGGLSSYQIAARLGCSPEGVRNRLLREGVQMRKRWDRVAA